MEWIALTFIFALISLGGSSVLYMLSKAFKLSGLERWCKSEYMEILISALIIIAVIAFVEGVLVVGRATLESIETGFVEAPSETYIGMNPANEAIREVYAIMGSVTQTYNHVFIVYYLASFVKEFMILGVSLNLLGPFVEAVMGSLEWALGTLGVFTLYMYFFAEIIKFGDYIAVILLPTGIVLRAFPPTRGAGAMFVAMALGLALVLPVSYLMVSFASGSSSQYISPFEIEGINEYNEMLENICMNDLGSMVMVKELALSLDYSHLLKMITEGGLFVMIIRVFISPLIALVITYTFIRSFATMLGSDLAEIGRGLVKLI